MAARGSLTPVLSCPSCRCVSRCPSCSLILSVAASRCFVTFWTTNHGSWNSERSEAGDGVWTQQCGSRRCMDGSSRHLPRVSRRSELRDAFEPLKQWPWSRKHELVWKMNDNYCQNESRANLKRRTQGQKQKLQKSSLKRKKHKKYIN